MVGRFEKEVGRQCRLVTEGGCVGDHAGAVGGRPCHVVEVDVQLRGVGCVGVRLTRYIWVVRPRQVVRAVVIVRLYHCHPGESG